MFAGTYFGQTYFAGIGVLSAALPPGEPQEADVTISLSPTMNVQLSTVENISIAITTEDV